MTPYALTAEQLLAAAMFIMFTDINRPIAVEQSSRLAAGELEMATQDVDLELMLPVRNMQQAAIQLRNWALNQPEGVDVSVALNTSDWLDSRANVLLPPQASWPTGKGLAEVIDMATWRRKA